MKKREIYRFIGGLFNLTLVFFILITQNFLPVYSDTSPFCIKSKISCPENNVLTCSNGKIGYPACSAYKGEYVYGCRVSGLSFLPYYSSCINCQCSPGHMYHDGSDRCIPKSNKVVCTKDYDPVCGCDGSTYQNKCVAKLSGITKFTSGECLDTSLSKTTLHSTVYLTCSCINGYLQCPTTTGSRCFPDCLLTPPYTRVNCSNGKCCNPNNLNDCVNPLCSSSTTSSSTSSSSSSTSSSTSGSTSSSTSGSCSCISGYLQCPTTTGSRCFPDCLLTPPYTRVNCSNGKCCNPNNLNDCVNPLCSSSTSSSSSSGSNCCRQGCSLIDFSTNLCNGTRESTGAVGVCALPLCPGPACDFDCCCPTSSSSSSSGSTTSGCSCISGYLQCPVAGGGRCFPDCLLTTPYTRVNCSNGKCCNPNNLNDCVNPLCH